MLNRLIEAKLQLRLRRDPQAALAILDALERDGDARRYDFIAEQLDMWHSQALLMSSPDADVVPALERAVGSMTAAGRILELPTAATLLAEAQWRRGDDDAADRAADLALVAARGQGSNHLLLQALADFPAVLSRRLDAEPGGDSPWHDIGRALRTRGTALDVVDALELVLTEFGAPEITVNGEPVHPRIAKSVALLAYLAAADDHEAGREELLDALFDGRADASARSYLRQAAHQLRRTLPAGCGPVFEGDRLRFSMAVRIVTDSGRLRSLVVHAARLQGDDRLALLLEAIALADRGEYLPGIDDAWIAARRDELAATVVEARLEAAQLAFAAARYPQADALTTAVLEADPFRESAWRLSMRIAAAIGDEDRVISAFEGCTRALGRVGAGPSGATQRLLAELRH